MTKAIATTSVSPISRRKPHRHRPFMYIFHSNEILFIIIIISKCASTNTVMLIIVIMSDNLCAMCCSHFRIVEVVVVVAIHCETKEIIFVSVTHNVPYRYQRVNFCPVQFILFATIVFFPIKHSFLQR